MAHDTKNGLRVAKKGRARVQMRLCRDMTEAKPDWVGVEYTVVARMRVIQYGSEERHRPKRGNVEGSETTSLCTAQIKCM